MKFSHGVWKWAEGITPLCVKRVTEYKIDGDRLWVAAVDRDGPDPSDRFEGLVLQLHVTSPMPDVIRVRIVHHRTVPHRSLKPPLDTSLAASNVQIQDLPDELTFTSGRLTLRVSKKKWSMHFEDAGNLITASGWNGLGQMESKSGGKWLMQRLSMGVGECLYGLGERFGPLVKNGQSISIWNEDGGTGSELAYKNIPFYLSNRGYGLLVNSTGRVDFEISTERISQVQLSVAEEELDYYVFRGPTPREVLEKYTRLSGRPALPPDWSFGLWLSTSFTTHYNEKTVNEFVDGMAKRGIPLSVFHFDCFWMKERHWCDFEWDPDAFPDPAGMLRRLKSKGLKVCVWINPYISQLSKLFPDGAEKGYFLKSLDGGVFQRDAWQPGMALVDFTNPAAVQWYCGKLRRLLEMGVDCFKTDFGEFIPENVRYHDGADPALMHNHYAYLYNKAVFELLEDFHGKGKALVFARSAAIGSQKFPVHWGGDCDATWESMAEDLRGGLSFCASGPAFWSHDIGGFSGTANAALYKRWVALGLLSTHSRLHGSSSYRVPWLFDEESVAVMRHFTRLKNRLFPYIFAAAHDAREHGWPVMRAMVIEFPDDPACSHLDRQFMLGSSLLVAPVFRQDGLVEYFVPRGRWTDFFTGEIIEGGSWRTETPDFMRIPLLVRENSIIPLGNNEEKPGWSAEDELTLHLFQIADGADLSISVPAGDELKPVQFRCRRSGAKFVLESEGRARNVKIALQSRRFAGDTASAKTRGAAGDTSVIGWADTAKPLHFSLKD